MRLYTFQISHFSEKARWALDLAGIPYEERRLLPGAHLFVTRRLGKKTSVPVLVDGETIVQGSSAILDRLESDPRFAPYGVAPEHRERAMDLEALADRAFGHGTQCIFYDALFEHPKSVVGLWTQRGPSWGRAFYAVMLPIIRGRMRKMYRIDRKGVAEAKDAFNAAFDEMDRALESKEFLFDQTLSRADIAIAALLAPLCRPKEHPLAWPEPIEKLGEFMSAFEGRPTWEWVLRMYRDHRTVR